MQTSITMKEAQFNKLCTEVEECRACPKMEFRRTFLNEHNGPIDAEVMFIGEATNVGLETQLPKPMWDSPSGTNLNNLLNSIGLNREQVFVTNTVLHTPVQDPREYPARMRYVTEDEQKNCSRFLLRQIELVNPKVICTLGNKALAGINSLYQYGFVLKRNAGWPYLIKGDRWLIPLYHPSPNVISTWRTFDQQVQDYRAIITTLSQLKEHENV